MPRRNRRPTPQRRRIRVQEIRVELTTDQMARRLVENGKADPVVLGLPPGAEYGERG
jgi:hypothetical protein